MHDQMKTYNTSIPVQSNNFLNPVIELKGVKKKFNKKTILNEIDLQIYEGEIFIIMGMSGCGKSTLLKNMSGLLVPDEGQVHVLRKNINTISADEKNEIKKSCSMVFQSSALLDSMTVFENISLPLVEHTDYDKELISAMVRNKLDLVGLEGVENFMPSELSGGMKKRVAFARAIINDPKVIFYDEPNSGLDPIVSGTIDKLIVDLSRKLSITSVVVSHSMQSIAQIADRVAMLHEGQIVEIGSYEDILQSKNPLVQQFISGNPEGPINFYKKGLDEYFI